MYFLVEVGLGLGCKREESGRMALLEGRNRRGGRKSDCRCAHDRESSGCCEVNLGVARPERGAGRELTSVTDCR